VIDRLYSRHRADTDVNQSINQSINQPLQSAKERSRAKTNIIYESFREIIEEEVSEVWVSVGEGETDTNQGDPGCE